MRLHIVRHADPDYEKNTITAAGHLEAKALAKRLEALGISKIYCSPLGRAIDTMKYFTERMHMEYSIVDWAQEISLRTIQEPWGNMTVVDVPGEIVRGTEPYNPDPEVLIWFEKIKLASDAFLGEYGYERIGGRYQIVKPNKEKIVVFCHAGMGMAWLAHLLGLPLTLLWSGFWPPPSSVTTILFEERS